MGRRRNDIPGTIFRYVLSVVILSAFIIGIALFVKGIHDTDQDKFISGFAKLLAKAHINVEEEKIGDVAGKFVERISNTNISASSTSRLAESSDDEKKDTELILEVAVIADVQEDLAALSRSISFIKERHINKVIVIGDLTNFGEQEDLNSVKKLLDESGLTYNTIPGDHDLAQALGSDNFINVFGDNNYVVEVDGFKFLFLDNSANYTPLLPATISWFNDEVKDADFVIMSQPLFTEGLNLPFSRMYMGSTTKDTPEDLVDAQKKVEEQRSQLLSIVRKSPVSAILAGDHHKSNTLVDPERESLVHHTLGAIAEEVNDLPQRLLQSPRFSILNVYRDKSFEVEEVLID